MPTLPETMFTLAPLLWLMGMVAGLCGWRRVASLLYALASIDALALGLLWSIESFAKSVGVLSYVVDLRLPPPLPETKLHFEVDVLTALFMVALSLSWLVASLMHDYYWVVEGRRGRAYTCLLGVAMLSMYIVLCARDFVSLLFGWEAMTLSLGLLVAYGGDVEAYRSSMFYLLVSHLASLPMYVCVAYALGYGATWYTYIPLLGDLFRVVAVVAFMLAFVTKSGLFPFHVWLPPAHSRAPSDASVILSGASVKPSLLQAILLVSSLGLPGYIAHLLIIQSLISIAVGVAGALWSREGKRVLAYTTVAYMGIMWTLLASTYWYGDEPLLALYPLLIAHAAYKSIGFATVGLAKAIWHTDEFGRCGGLCFNDVLCNIASLASGTIGLLPPFVHFYGELLALLVLTRLPDPRAAAMLASCIVLPALAIGLAYMRVLSLLHSAMKPPRPVPKPDVLYILGIGVVAAFAPVALCVWLPKLLPITTIVVYAALAIISLLVGAYISSKAVQTKTWLSGEEVVYAKRVTPAQPPLAITAPRVSIERFLARFRRPWLREVSYESLYRVPARFFSRYVLKPLLKPMFYGQLGLYIAVMLAYFALIILCGGWAP